MRLDPLTPRAEKITLVLEATATTRSGSNEPARITRW
jgi:hypothetical protein